MTRESPVSELRVALTVENYEEAVRFYRDVFGLPVESEWEVPEGKGMILSAGHATLELLSTGMTARVDQVEAGGHTSGPVRLALEVADSSKTADALEAGGGKRLGGPVVTPWNDRNVRLEAPDGMQLTLFTVLDKPPGE